jgi:addiction module HigA family antidote
MATLKAHHPGAILREEFMEPVGLTPYKLAKALEVPLPRVNGIVLEKRSISAEMGLLLSAYFGTTDQYWINLQADYDRRLARSRIEKKLKSIKPHPTDKDGSLVSAA